jgi:hypothetical protein
LLEAVRYVAAQLQQKIPTAILNRTINDAIERRQPVSAAGHRLKFYYATQVRQAPPTFLLFVNRDELFSDQYKKSLANELRTAFGYEGCPIVLVPKPRPKTVLAKRKFRITDKNKLPGKFGNRPFLRATGKPTGKPGGKPDSRPFVRPTGKSGAKPFVRPAGGGGGKPTIPKNRGERGKKAHPRGSNRAKGRR